jgi:predicted transposase/invertase (TIGR01784 family)
MHEVYDRGYKKLFSNKALFRQLLESFVPLEWVKELDFDHCELLDKTFISKEYEKRESDVIYQVQLRGQTAYIVILIEFQSSVDKFMALRILHYISSFYMRLKDSEAKIDKLPPIFPIMVYSGQAQWTAPIDIAELIEHHDLLGEFALNFRYFKIAENEISAQKLFEMGNVVATLFLGEAHHDRKLLVEALSKLSRKLPSPEDRQLISMLFNFFEQLFYNNKLTEVDWQAFHRVLTDSEMNMFLENMKICDEIAYQKGILAGEQTGMLKGKLEGKLETARAMLAEGLNRSLIIKVTGLSESEIEQLRH